MTVRQLIDQLEQIADTHDDDCSVVVLVGDEEWPFDVHVEAEMIGKFPKMVVCLEITSTDHNEQRSPIPFNPL